MEDQFKLVVVPTWDNETQELANIVAALISDSSIYGSCIASVLSIILANFIVLAHKKFNEYDDEELISNYKVSVMKDFEWVLDNWDGHTKNVKEINHE